MKEKREKHCEDNYPHKTKPLKTKKLKSGSLGAREIKNNHQLTKEINLLFICSRNQWRSPTAEKIYKNQPTKKYIKINQRKNI